MEFYYEAFKKLTSCRGAAYNSEGPIPWTAIREYSIAVGIDQEDDRDYFYEVITTMDAAFLRFKTKKAAAK